ncbi:MAG TPA: hypothetical protein VK986_04850 [Tepidisphaeraceae bacterium]|nr:hypothetical protein [Tepidisphaeraceae bacterium]
MNRIGCDEFEVYEQAGTNWGTSNQAQPTNRFVQIMKFRDRKHQLAVQAAERTDAGAQQVIAEFCELVNFPYQQERGLFVVGFYTSATPVAPVRKGPGVEQAHDDTSTAAATGAAAAIFAATQDEVDAAATEESAESEFDEQLPAEDEPLDAASDEADAASDLAEAPVDEQGDDEDRGEQGGFVDETLDGPMPTMRIAGSDDDATEEVVAEADTTDETVCDENTVEGEVIEAELELPAHAEAPITHAPERSEADTALELEPAGESEGPFEELDLTSEGEAADLSHLPAAQTNGEPDLGAHDPDAEVPELNFDDDLTLDLASRLDEERDSLLSDNSPEHPSSANGHPGDKP